jgi:uncharacterized protein YbjQ (UPF0145 family)
MIITTTPNVEGKQIKKYLGLVTGTDIYLVGGVFGGGLANQENLFGRAFENACTKMSNKAAAKKADAIVGVTYTVSSPGSTADIIVTVTGTAVTLGEKEVETDELPDMF